MKAALLTLLSEGTSQLKWLALAGPGHRPLNGVLQDNPQYASSQNSTFNVSMLIGIYFSFNSKGYITDLHVTNETLRYRCSLSVGNHPPYLWSAKLFAS